MLRCRAGAGSFLVVALASTRGRAEPCQVELVPADAPGWTEAFAAVARRVHDQPSDCASIRIETAGRSARLVFTTHDGRQAERSIDRPDHLAATVTAVLVTTPLAKSVELVSAKPMLGLAPAVTAEPTDRSPAPKPIPAKESDHDRSAHLLIALGAGGRYGGPGDFAGPHLAATAGISIAHWEIAAGIGWTPIEGSLAVKANGLSMSTYTVGVQFERRQPIAFLDGLLGITAAASITNEVGVDPVDKGGAGGWTNAEPHLGFYTGAAFPRRSPFRIRPTIAFDFVPTRVNRPLTFDSALPPLPWWGLTGALAIEWEAL